MSKLERVFMDVAITHPGGWMASGVMHSTYTRDASGWYEKCSPRHYYCRELGRDIYPSKEKIPLLLAGEPVVMGLNEWK